jgi:diguanylate cyclase (GGDEF)-like protein/PAS domain S-box-containing protein
MRPSSLPKPAAEPPDRPAADRERRLKQLSAELELTRQRLQGAIEERDGLAAALRESEIRGQRAEAQLRQAIDSISEGVVLWDADDRLVLCNQRYRYLYRELGDTIRPGVSFTELASKLAGCGCVVEAVGREAAWVAERIRHRREAVIEPLERRLADGRWLRIVGRRTAEGGIVTVHSDITEFKRQAEDLRVREAQLRGIIDNIPGVVYRRVRHPDGRISYPYHSPQIERRHGIDPEAVARDASLLQGAVHPDDRPVWLAAIEESARRLTPFAGDYRILTRDDGFHWFRTLATPTRHDDGTVVWDGVSIDITELKATEATLRESEERQRRLIETAPIALLTCRQGRVSFANNKACELFGAPSFADLDDRSLESLIHPGDRSLADPPQETRDIASGFVGPREIRILRLDGKVVDVEAVSVPLIGQGQPANHMVLLDITERKRAEQRALHLAHHDALTGLPNRTLLLDRLRQALIQARRERKRLAVVMLDLDHFKTINDSLGHPVGDRLLCAVADRLREKIRESDTLARLGGDEFTLVQTGLYEPGGAGVLADKLIRAVAEPFTIDRRNLRTTTSAGIAIYPEDGTEPEALIERADVALYQAKARGRNRLAFFLDPPPGEIAP